MKKLSKKQAAELAALLEKLNDAAQQYEQARSQFNEFRDDIATEIADYIEERSDAWQEGERGEAHREWCGQWENEGGQDVDLEADPDEYPDAPEEV